MPLYLHCSECQNRIRSFPETCPICGESMLRPLCGILESYRSLADGSAGFEATDLRRQAAEIVESLSMKLLTRAVRKGSAEEVAALVRARAIVNVWDSNGNTPLMMSAMDGHAEIARILVAAGADVNARGPFALTALHMATSSPEITRELLAAGAEADALHEKGGTPLEIAASLGNHEVVAALVAGGADVDGKDRTRLAPLTIAAFEGHSETVNVLLGAGADANVQAAGRVPLHAAAARGHAAIVRLLLDAGANPDRRAGDARTPLHFAAAAGHEEVVRWLIDAGASIQARTCNGTTPMEEAERNGHMPVAELLRSCAGASQDVSNDSVARIRQQEGQ